MEINKKLEEELINIMVDYGQVMKDYNNILLKLNEFEQQRILLLKKLDDLRTKEKEQMKTLVKDPNFNEEKFKQYAIELANKHLKKLKKVNEIII